MKREIKFQIIYANQIDGYERLIEKDGHIFWQWMCLEMNPANSEKWISGVYPKQYKYIRRQFTGLADKNGKEIYEGDLISESGSSPYEVKWQCHSVKWIMQSFEEGRYYREMHSDYAKNNYEIIGNIYENPELT
jgi:hypothetical protein